jgi:hypothetical protein
MTMLLGGQTMMGGDQPSKAILYGNADLQLLIQ